MNWNRALISGMIRRKPSLLSSARPQALPASEKAFFESRLGQDFSKVRLHTDESAAASASALGAKAFASGNDIGFASGRYRPGTAAGRQLLAHELVHVAQQGRGGSGTTQSEPRARAAAERVTQGEAVSPQAQGGAAQGLHCDPDDDKKKAEDSAPHARPFKMPTLAPPGTSYLTPPTLTPPPGLPLPSLMPSPMLQPNGLSPGALGPLPPITPPYHLMVNADILAPFSAYGSTPLSAGMDIPGDWAKAYFMFRNYMPESLAATSANMFLSSAYQSSFAFNQPSIFDKSNLDFKAAHPDETHTPIIPFLSSGSMTSVYEWITKKKDTNAFYF